MLPVGPRQCGAHARLHVLISYPDLGYCSKRQALVYEEFGLSNFAPLRVFCGGVPASPILATRRRRGGGSSATPSTKPMEQMLWDAACSIRGEKDAPKFKDYLLPLLFLKRLSDVFDDEIARLAENYGDCDTALEIAEGDHSLLRFYVPPEARWGVISGRETYEWPPDDKGQSTDEHLLESRLAANSVRDAADWLLENRKQSTRPKDIGEHLTKAVRAVVKQNPTLSASSTSSTLRPNGMVSATSIQASCASWSRRFLIRAIAWGLLMCSPISSAAHTNICCANSPKARARARANSSLRPKSAS